MVCLLENMTKPFSQHRLISKSYHYAYFAFCLFKIFILHHNFEGMKCVIIKLIVLTATLLDNVLQALIPQIAKPQPKPSLIHGFIQPVSTVFIFFKWLETSKEKYYSVLHVKLYKI